MKRTSSHANVDQQKRDLRQEMFMMIGMSNPFESPQTPEDSNATPPHFAHDQHVSPNYEALPRNLWPQLDIRVASIEGRWGKTIRLEGRINVTLEYQTWGMGERLYIEGHLIHTTDPMAATLALVSPFIDFNLFLDRFHVPGRIDVKASYFKLFQISRFKLTVAGKVLYEQ